jgi:hypothetical protein
LCNHCVIFNTLIWFSDWYHAVIMPGMHLLLENRLNFNYSSTWSVLTEFYQRHYTYKIKMRQVWNLSTFGLSFYFSIFTLVHVCVCVSICLCVIVCVYLTNKIKFPHFNLASFIYIYSLSTILPQRIKNVSFVLIR